MTSESEPIRKNNQTPNTGGKPDTQTPQGNKDIPRTSSVSSSPPSKTHCEITCKTEKNFWDHVKTGAEIIGIILLGVYTAYTIKMYGANKIAADAAKSAADTARKQLEMTRPWLTSEFVPTSLLFKEDGGFLGLNITVANTGNSVAKSITTLTELWLDTRTLLSEGKRYCEIPKSPENRNYEGGSILFPGQHYTFHQPATTTTEVIEKALKSGDFKDQHQVTIYLITCIDYRSTLDTEHHQTRSYFTLSRPDFQRHTMLGIFDPHGTYAPSQFTMDNAGYGSVD